MNTIVFELAEQAGMEIEETEGTIWWIGNSDLELFAQLIVKECIDIISPYAIRMENFDGGHPITDLKKQFGVE